MGLTKEQFDKLYVGENLAVHCNTEDKANEFLELADMFGYKWYTGKRYTKFNQWSSHKVNTCYRLHSGDYGRLRYYYDVMCIRVVSYPQHSTLLKEFTKSDLKSGDKVVYRDEEELFVLIETQSLHDSKSGYQDGYLSSYDEFLKHKVHMKRDIMKVYRDNILIWERAEEPQKTAQQIEIERIEKEMREISVMQNKLADELSRVKEQK